MDFAQEISQIHRDLTCPECGAQMVPYAAHKCELTPQVVRRIVREELEKAKEEK